MTKTLLILIALTGCSEGSTQLDTRTLEVHPNLLDRVCIEGVKYYQLHPHGIAPAYHREGTLQLCE